MPYRIPAPPEPEPVEVEHPYAAVLRSQRRRARIFSAVVLVLAGGGLAKVASSKEPPPRRAGNETARADGARTAIAGARTRAAAAQSRFETGVREAIAQGTVPRPDLGACPISLRSFTLHGTASSLAGSARRGEFPLLVLERSELGETLPSQRVAEVLADVRRAESHLAAGRYEEAAIYGRALDRPERFGWDVVLVARASKKPFARSGSEYEPGEIEGRAYVFDFASGRVICAGDVHATSSKAIGYSFSDRADAPARLGAVASMGDAIDEDIRMQTHRAIAEAVRWRSGPPL